MTLPKKRRRFLPENKLSLLKRHFVGNESVSDICDEEDLHPNQFYRWQSELFTNDGKAFTVSNRNLSIILFCTNNLIYFDLNFPVLSDYDHEQQKQKRISVVY